MTNLVRELLASLFVLGVGWAHAAPVSGQGTWETTLRARDLDGNGTTDAFYDTDLGITWLRNANAGAGSSFDNGGVSAGTQTDGKMHWDNAVNWAGALTVGTYSGWRLPTTLQPDATCDFFSSYGPNCSGSEMGHLWYVALGNASGSLTNTGDFQNVQGDDYWSGTERASDTRDAWLFNVGGGAQSANAKSDVLFAWAVTDGDIGTAIPEPGTLALLALGLAGLGYLRRKQ